MGDAPIVVQKYGGSSVADPERIRKVAARVVETARSGKRVVVVVSAMGDTTDELLELARGVNTSPSRRELDMLLSCGERISIALVAMAIGALDHPVISLTGAQSGIITNDRHSGARIIEVRPVRIHDELDQGKVVVVAGFQGVTAKREITTLGRGGSDTTAVALAAALGAECEICSDVDGIYTGDPRMVEAASLYDAISHDAMQELAEHGAKVLNAQAIELARLAGIAIYARATAQAPGQGGTRIGGPPPPSVEGRVQVGVTGFGPLTRVQVRGAAYAALLEALAADRVPLLHTAVGEDTADAVFGRDDLPDWTGVRDRLRARLGDALITWDDELGAVTAVGLGLGRDPHMIERALRAVRGAGAVPRGVDTGPLRVTVIVHAGEVAAATRALHGEFSA